jgi:hypothetical protein
MADDVKPWLESALNKLLSIKEKSSNLSKDLKQDIEDSVSTLRSIFVNLRNCRGANNKNKQTGRRAKQSQGGAYG